MNKKSTSSLAVKLAGTVVGLLMFAAPAQSASVSYFLNQSNALADGTNYLKVTIADGSDGAIDFKIEILPALLEFAGENFGIQVFGFNTGDSGARSRNASALPAGWSARGSNRISEFGIFDIRMAGTGSSRVDPLTFSITGINGDTVNDYVEYSRRNAAGGNQFFVAKVGGFNCISNDRCFDSAFFAGSTAMDPVPLPATAWLFLTGMAGIAVRARRRFSER